MATLKMPEINEAIFTKYQKTADALLSKIYHASHEKLDELIEKDELGTEYAIRISSLFAQACILTGMSRPSKIVKNPLIKPDMETLLNSRELLRQKIEARTGLILGEPVRSKAIVFMELHYAVLKQTVVPKA